VEPVLVLVDHEYARILSLVDDESVVKAVPNSYEVIYRGKFPLGVGYLMCTIGQEINVEMCKNDFNLTFKMYLILLHYFMRNWFPFITEIADCRTCLLCTIIKLFFWIDFAYGCCHGKTSANRYSDLSILLNSILVFKPFSELLNTLVQNYINCNNNHLEKVMKQIAEEVFQLPT
jgi:hypothetical protein